MKSKSSLFSAIALVAIAGFFFTACPQSGEDEDTTPATFTVTFNVNGGSAVAPISDVASGAKISKPADPAKKDSTFVGWYKEAALTTAWNFNSDTVTADITLYAKWGASKASIAAGAAVGTDAVAAVYTLTIETALIDGETLTIENVATDAVEYLFEEGVTSTDIDLQTEAVADAIGKAAGALYEASASGNEISLTAKKAGAVALKPLATVTTATTGAANATATLSQSYAAAVKAVFTLPVGTPAEGEFTLSDITEDGSPLTVTVSAATAGSVANTDVMADTIAAVNAPTSGSKYIASEGGSSGSLTIILTAKTAGDATTPAASGTKSGNIGTIGVTTEGKNAVVPQYTITINTALAKSEYFTIENVGSAAVKYSFATSATTPEQQATAIAAAITKAKGLLYVVSSASGRSITLTAKTAASILPANAPKITPLFGITGGATVSDPDPAGANAIKALYTLTLNAELTEGETLTIENVAGAPVKYVFESAKATVDTQLKAIADAITKASGSLYKATVKNKAITLEAKTAGVIAAAPTVAISR